MSRVKGGAASHARHRKVVKQAAGYYGARSTNYRTAKQAVDKALQYATRDRKVRKRTFRALWIQRINAAVREHDAEPHLLAPHRRPDQGRHRGRPQGPRRPRRARARRLRRHRRPGEVRARLSAAPRLPGGTSSAAGPAAFARHSNAARMPARMCSRSSAGLPRAPRSCRLPRHRRTRPQRLRAQASRADARPHRRRRPPKLGLHVILGPTGFERMGRLFACVDQGLLAPVEMVATAT